MKINDSNQLAASQSSAARLQQAAYSSGAARTQQPHDISSASGDNVHLSSLSASIRAQNTESPDRSAHVARLAAAVQGGTYKVDAAAVSRGLVNDSISLR